MKVLHIDIEGGYGGSSRSLAKLVIGIKTSYPDIESVVLCKASGPIQNEYLAIGVQCEVFKHMFSRIPLPEYNFRNLLTSIPDLPSLFKLHRRIKEIKPDVVHFNYAGLMFNGILLKLTGFGGKIIIHSRVLWPQNMFARLFTFFLGFSSDHIVAIAEPVREAHTANGLNQNCISVIYNPSSNLISINEARAPEPQNERCSISYFGTIGNLKGASRLIELADYLRGKQFHHSINIYGNAPRRSSITKDLNIELLKIQDRQNLSEEFYEFKYRGFVETPEVAMKLADFIVRPSFSNDPWGRDVIEGMSLGRVVIATGDFSGFIKNGENGFLIGDWDTKTIGNLIINTWSDKENLRRIQNNAALFAQRAFSPQQSASKFLGLIVG